MLFFPCQATLLGAAVAPVLGGIVSHYASWRLMQFFLALCGLFLYFLVYFFLPETSHPGSRGMDKAALLLASSRDDLPVTSSRSRSEWAWVWLNPFSSLALLRSPNVLCIVSSPRLDCRSPVGLIGSCVCMNWWYVDTGSYHHAVD